jgi:hypothetical protein
LMDPGEEIENTQYCKAKEQRAACSRSYKIIYLLDIDSSTSTSA